MCKIAAKITRKKNYCTNFSRNSTSLQDPGNYYVLTFPLPPRLLTSFEAQPFERTPAISKASMLASASFAPQTPGQVYPISLQASKVRGGSPNWQTKNTTMFFKRNYASKIHQLDSCCIQYACANTEYSYDMLIIA